MAKQTQTELDKLAESLSRLSGNLASTTVAVGAFGAGLAAVAQKIGSEIAGLVALASPGHVALFNIVLRDTMAVIGRMLIPTIERFTGIIRMMGDALASLDPIVKTLIGGLAAGGGLAGAVAGVASAIAIIVKLLGGWLTALVGIVSAVVGVLTVTAEWKSLMSAVSEIFGVLGTAATILATAAVPLLGVLGDVARVVADLVQSLMPAMAVTGQMVSAIATVIAAGLRPAIALFELLSGALAPIAKLLGTIGQALATFVEVGAAIFATLMELAVSSTFGVVISLLKDFAATIDRLVERLRNWINEIRAFFGLPALFEPDRKKSAGTAVTQASVTSDLSGILNRLYSSAAMVGTGGAEDIPKQQLGSLEKIRELLAQIPGLVWDKFVALYEYIKSLPMELAVAIVESLPTEVVDKAGQAIDWAGDQGREAWDMIKPKLPGIGTGYARFGIPGAILGGLF